MVRRILRKGRVALLCLSVLALHMAGAAAQAQQQENHLLNFRDADIRALIDDISMMTGNTFIIDPRVKGKVTVISREPVPGPQVFDIFLSTLRVYGFTAVTTSSGAYKIVPDEAAMQDGNAAAGEAVDDILVTEIFRLRNIDPITALNSVKPIVHRQGRAIAHRNHDFLLIVDYAGNMERIRRVLRDIDADLQITRIVSLENTGAEEMADMLVRLRGASGGEDGGDAAFSALPMTSSNTLVLRGADDVIARLIPLIEDLDARNANKGDIRVIYLKHADAEKLVPVLEGVSKSMGQRGGGEGGSANAEVSIVFEKGTNALLISASPDMQNALERVIKQLDVPRAQVLVEAIIVDVSDTAARELGLQYILSGGDGSTIPFTATNFSSRAPNILAATGALLGDRLDLSDDALNNLQQAAVDSLVGLNGFTGGFAGQTSDGTIFGVILNAVQRDIASNVLSTPSVMTMDNETAKILVGQEIPITTGEALGANNANPFRTVNRQDVGIELEVQPQINEGDDILLYIRQEVSSVLGSVVEDSPDLITQKREIETTVMVKNGEILVLGGLIQSDESITAEKVPLLGDIPLLGNLFKSNSRSLQKTNLMVFIRPTIIRNAEDMRAVTERKYNVMRGEQILRKGSTEGTLDYMVREVIGTANDIPQLPIAPADSGGN